ncbi:hypothetical protein GCM10028786_22080 [Flaviaesturariibacter terrae]
MTGSVTSTASAPTLTTPTATSISATGATLGANITNYNGSNATQYGTIYSTTDPGVSGFSTTTGNNPSTLGANSTTGAFTDARTGLSAQTLYYYAGYATNGTGTGFSPKGSFYTLSAPATAGAGSFTATGSSSSQIDLSWTAATFPVSGASQTGYVILRAAGATAPSASVLVNGAAPTGVANYLNTTTGSATSYPNGGLSSSTQYSYTLVPFTWDNVNAATYNYYTAGAVTATGSSLANLTPAISSSPTSISFSSIVTGSTGTATAVTPTASNFSGSGTVTVTAPNSNFQVSNDNSSWGSSTTLAYSANTLTPSGFWVRFSPQGAGAKSGNVTVTADNGATVNVAVSGTAYAAAPTAPASWNLAATASAAGSVTLNWSAATFANTGGYLVVYSTGTPALTGAPNGIAAGQSVVSTGTAAPLVGAGATSTVISGLTPGSTYNFLLVAYNWDGSSATTYNYLTGNTASTSLLVIGTPSVTTTTATVTGPTTATAGGSGVNANSGNIAQKGVVYAKATTTTNPTLALNDGFTTEGAGTADFPASSLSGLSAQTQYYYTAYATNEVATGYGSVANFRTYSAEPTSAATGFSAIAAGATQINLTWTAASFPVSGASSNGYIIVRRLDNGAVTGVTDGTAPGSLTLNSGSTLATTVTSGSTTSYSDGSGLSGSTTYYYTIIPYTYDGTNGGTYNYYLTGAPSANATTTAATNATDAFRSLGSGAWGTAGTWESFTNGSWMTASSAPTSSAASISILAGHAITSTGTVTGKNLSIAATGSLSVSSGTLTLASASSLAVDGTLTVGGTLTLSSGANTVTINGTVNNNGTINLNGTTTISGSWYNGNSSTGANGILAIGTGSTVSVGGTFTSYADNNASITVGGVALSSANTPFTFSATGTYNHAPVVNSTNYVLYANWSIGSICQILAPASTIPNTTSLRQSFHHLVWNNDVQTFSMQLGGNLTSIGGDLRVLNTGTGKLSIASSQSPTLTIGGSLTVGGLSGKTATLQGASTTGAVIMNIAGAVNILTGGTFDPSSSGSNSGYTQMNISGDFNLNGGSLLAQGTSGTGASATQMDINMVGSGATQLLTWNGAANSINNRMIFLTIGNGSNSSKVQLQSGVNMASSVGDIVVKNKATLDAQGYVISGSNATLTFSVNSGAAMMTAHDGGLSSTGSTGAVQVVGTRTYNSAAKYTFSGASTGAPTFSTVNNVTTLEIAGNVASGFGATQTVTNLVLTSGTFSSASARTFSIPASGTVTMGGGNVAVSASGITVSFAGAGSFVGNAAGTLNNVTINGGAVSLTSGTAPTIGGTLLMASSAGSLGFAPYYASGSLLQYNASLTRGNEWSSNAATAGTLGSTAGYPNNVTVSSNSTLTMLSAGGTTDRAIAGTLTVNSGSTFNNGGRSGALSVGALTNAGTFSNTASSGKIIVNGSVSNSGTITLSTTAGNDLDVYGDWTRVGAATFTDNNRTVSFLGSSNAGITAASSVPVFNNLVINKTGGATLTLNNAVSAPANVYLTAGTVASAGNLQLSSASVITRNTGSLDAAPSFGSGIDVVYTGAVTTGFELPSTNIVRNVTVNSAGSVTLNKAVTVNGTLTLTSGKMDVDAYDLTVAAGSVSGGSTTSYVKTSGAGALHIKSVGASAQAFPVGNSTYNPLDLSSGTMQGWKVRVEDAIANVGATYSANLAKAVSRQWDLVPDSANPVPSPGVTATFYYNGTTDVGASFSNSTDVQLWHYDAVGGWAKRGSAVTPATVNGLKAATVSGLTYFSPFALSNIDAPLPVSLLAFTGKRTNNVNELKWITASESNNRGFAIERSADGSRFTEVGFVASRAQGGTSTSDITYSYTDASAGSAGQGASSKWYYRLKQQDLDGQYKYSAVVLLKGDKSGILTLDGIYPNPVKGTASIRLQASALGGSVVLQLTDMLGKVVRTQPVLTEAGSSTTVQMNVSGLPAGQYHLKAFAANGDASETVTLIKQ